MQAGPRAERMLDAANVRYAMTMEYQHDLVIRVAVFWSAPRRDLAYELSRDRAIAFWTEQDAELPVTGCLDLAVGEDPAPQRTASGI